MTDEDEYREVAEAYEDRLRTALDKATVLLARCRQRLDWERGQYRAVQLIAEIDAVLGTNEGEKP